MPHIHVWCQDEDIKKEIEDILESKANTCLGWALPCSSVQDYKIAFAAKSYLKSTLQETNVAPKLGFALDGDCAVDFKKALETVASRAIKNEVDSEKVVIVTSKQPDQIELSSYTQHTFIERRISASGIKRLDSAPDKIAVKIQAILLKSFLADCKQILPVMYDTIRYLDILIDPDYKTGIVALSISGSTSLNDLMLPEEIDLSTSTDKKDVVLTAFFPCMFFENNTYLNPMEKVDFVTKMNRGLKTKIRSMTKITSEVIIGFYTEINNTDNSTYLNITLDAKQKDGAIVRSVLATINDRDPKIPKEIFETYRQANIVLDAHMLDESIDIAKGELDIGLGKSLIVFTSPEITVALSTKIGQANTSDTEEKINEQKPKFTQEKAKNQLSIVWLDELTDKGDYLEQVFPDLGIIIKIAKKVILTKSEKRNLLLQGNNLASRVFEVLKAHVNKPLTSAAILELLSDSDVKPSSLTTILSNLYKAGLIEKQKRGVFIYKDDSILNKEEQDWIELKPLTTTEMAIGEKAEEVEVDEEEEKALLEITAQQM